MLQYGVDILPDDSNESTNIMKNLIVGALKSATTCTLSPDLLAGIKAGIKFGLKKIGEREKRNIFQAIFYIDKVSFTTKRKYEKYLKQELNKKIEKEKE